MSYSSLNISKRTIYETFKDKEEILLSVLSEMKARRKAEFESLYPMRVTL